jgi:hypothetical protein
VESIDLFLQQRRRDRLIKKFIYFLGASWGANLLVP